MPTLLSPLQIALEPLQRLAQTEPVTSVVRRVTAASPAVIDRLPGMAAQPLRMVVDLVDGLVGNPAPPAAAEEQEAPDEAVLPFPIEEYDGLNAQVARTRIQELHDPQAVATVISYERDHKNRASVINVAEGWLAELRNGNAPTQ